MSLTPPKMSPLYSPPKKNTVWLSVLLKRSGVGLGQPIRKSEGKRLQFFWFDLYRRYRSVRCCRLERKSPQRRRPPGSADDDDDYDDDDDDDDDDDGNDDDDDDDDDSTQ